VDDDARARTIVASVLAWWQVARVERDLLPWCSTSDPWEVVRLWAGLGYNRRALGLHGDARAIVERHGGEVPATLGELLALPGVGPYTARAVLATAFGEQAAVVGVIPTRTSPVGSVPEPCSGDGPMQ